MIEVEIRGVLTETEFHALKEKLGADGELIEEHEREMILLRGYPGYSEDPIVRETDVRLRTTNGNAELMVKRRASEHNVGRHEVSLPLPSFAEGKEAVKALGFSSGLWMHRLKHVYRVGSIEWSLVEAPDKHFYYEAEREVPEGTDLGAVHAELMAAAGQYGLSVLGPEEMRDFIYMLDKAVNKEITW